MSVQLTQADMAAIAAQDSDYLNNKGARLYAREDYAAAIEYYRLAASMGNVASISNLGYCYMYARSIPGNMSLALAYFQIAAERRNVDALYKLGNIYQRGAEGIAPDQELSVYYYQKAAEALEYWSDAEDVPLTDYPSLFFSLAKAHLPDGQLLCDIGLAWHDLQIARSGYQQELQNGIQYHRGALNAVEKLMQNPIFADFAREEDREAHC